VEWYWILEGSDCVDPQPIVPDGRVEIVLHFGDRFERHHAGGLVERQDAALFVGQILAPIRLACRGRLPTVGELGLDGPRIRLELVPKNWSITQHFMCYNFGPAGSSDARGDVSAGGWHSEHVRSIKEVVGLL
jgi:hypothetical protein